MKLFKTTEEKFEEDKKRKVILTLLRVYRDDGYRKVGLREGIGCISSSTDF